jgi:preprotein translocase subunit SecG
MLYYLVAGLYVLVCFFLLGVILLQQGKGGDMASAFGGSSSQTAFGARAGATVLSKATAILAVLFLTGALALTIMGQRGTSSVMGGTAPPAPTAPTPAKPETTPGKPETTPSSAPAPAPSSTPPATPDKKN